jgi:hypothetical protein
MQVVAMRSPWYILELHTLRERVANFERSHCDD